MKILVTVENLSKTGEFHIRNIKPDAILMYKFNLNYSTNRHKQIIKYQYKETFSFLAEQYCTHYIYYDYNI